VQRRDFIKGICACCSTLGISELLGATREIKKGDTLYSISRECEVSVAEIIKANPGLDPAKLKIGQIIQLPDTHASAKPAAPPAVSPAAPPTSAVPPPPGLTPPPHPEFHTVARGDTLSNIARKYGLSLTELRQLNPAASDIIAPGQQLRLRRAGEIPVVDSGPPPEPGRSTIVVPTESQTPPPKPAPPQTPAPDSKDPPPKYEFVTGKTKASIDRPRLGHRVWRHIVVHHSGTKTGNAKIFDYFHRRVRGMENGMAYHFVIGNGTESGDGEIEVGERWTRQLQGGHVRSEAQNEVSIGICLVGNFESDQPTRKQIASLIELVTYLRSLQKKPSLTFFMHRDINITPTTCPGRRFPAQALYRVLGRAPKPKT
jgi:LysM repeat protein